MAAELAQSISTTAQREEKASHRRAVISHVTHYVLGIGAAAAAATAGVLAALGAPDVLAAIAGGVGALVASVQTFMTPSKRAAFHYGLRGDYEQLANDATLVAAGQPDDAKVEALSKRLAGLRKATAKDLSG
jgi:hypothetical protein